MYVLSISEGTLCTNVSPDYFVLTDLIFDIVIYSNKKETSDFHGTVSFDPVKMLQQK